MIPRYTRPDMAAIWAPQTRYRIWFEIEAHAADAMAELGIIPEQAAKKIWRRAATQPSTSPASTRLSVRSSMTSSPFSLTSPRSSGRRPAMCTRV